MKVICISDLHPERVYVKDLKNWMSVWRAAGWKIVFIGDCRTYPDDYGKYADVSVIGNHEVRFLAGRFGMLDAYRLSPDTLCVHGHNAEVQALPVVQTAIDVRDLFLNAWMRLWRKKSRLVGERRTKLISRWDEIADEDLERLPDLDKWVVERYPSVKRVIMGHHHEQYVWSGDSGIMYYNCGAGYQGEHISVRNGRIKFHQFR